MPGKQGRNKGPVGAGLGIRDTICNAEGDNVNLHAAGLHGEGAKERVRL